MIADNQADDRLERPSELEASVWSRLQRQIQFIVEIDKVKGILRQSLVLDSSRRENDAEHSWHLAVMAILLAEYAPKNIDLTRVVKMALIHDIVEIDAGDTILYDQRARAEKVERERLAAQRIFGMLPADQRDEYTRLWEEFEARQTSEAKFAGALDRLQPILANYHTHGSTWREHDVTHEQVVAFNKHMQEGAPALWSYAASLIKEAVKRGYLR